MEVGSTKLKLEAIVVPFTRVPRTAVMAQTKHATVWEQAAFLAY